MIRVTVELLPRGMTEGRRTLGVGVISNDGSGSASRGNYRATFKQPHGKMREGRVESFPRQTLGCWELLARALKGAGIQ